MLAVPWALLILTQGVFVDGSGVFGYDPQDKLGPNKWADEFSDCAGKYQSPIDIEESLVTNVYLPPLKFKGIHELPLVGFITNNGHTVLLEINSTQPVTISGGPLKDTYTFEQLHFHWGSNDSFGSEDLINNRSYSMELHMVFFKSGYETSANALNFKDGLAVLAVFFEISDEDNKAYAELVDSLKHIVWPQTKARLPYLLPIEYLLPRNMNDYFTYNGSLTTPPCLEIVTWIDFKDPIKLSHKQLAMFRKLRSFDGLLTQNVRPVQPLHGRHVLYNSQSTSNSDESASSMIHWSQETRILNFFVILLLISTVVG